VPPHFARAATRGSVTAAPEASQHLVLDGDAYAQPAPTLTPRSETATPQVYDDNFAGWLDRQMDNLRELFEGWGQE
jgi:hypothetical protein